MSNAYDLIYRDQKNIRARLIKKLVKEGLFHKMDSGGFQLMKQQMKGEKIHKFNPKMVYKIQKAFFCDIGVTLDVPIGTLGNENKKYININKTIENFEKLLRYYEKNDNFSILPVIHGHNFKMIDYAIKRIRNVLNEPIKAVGIGSLVPMLKTVKNSDNAGGKENFIRILLYLRKKLPNSFIHAFGVGGTMSYLAYLCGIDSLDSTGWILKASRGVIQLPGISDRFLKKKSHSRPYLIENRSISGSEEIINEKKIFMECECPVCSKYRENGKWNYTDWIKKRNDFDKYTKESRMKRVIHNLWLYQNELKNIRKATINNNIIGFVEKRLQNSRYRSLFRKIKSEIKMNQIRIQKFL